MSIFKIDLATAGKQTIDLNSGLLRFINCETASGALDLNGKVNVRLGQTDSETVVLRLNNAVSGVPARHITLSWDAQSGLTATFLLSPDKSTLDIDADPPAQLVTGELASNVGNASVTVGTSAVLLASAASTRKSLTIQNLGASEIYIGGSGVTTANGLKVASGQPWTTTTATGAYYAIGAAAGLDVRLLEET